MGWFWDDLQAGWNDFVQGVTHPGDILKLGEKIFAAFVQEGIWIEQRIIPDLLRAFLLIGLNPLEVIPQLAAYISRHGGNITEVLECLAQGILQHGGLENFGQKLFNGVIAMPFQTHAQQQSQTAFQLASVHLQTVAGMNAIIAPLYGGQIPQTTTIPDSSPFQGETALYSLQLHQATANNLTQLGTILAPGQAVSVAHNRVAGDINWGKLAFMTGVVLLIAVIDLILIAIFAAVDVLAVVTGPGEIALGAGEITFIVALDIAIFVAAGSLYDALTLAFKSAVLDRPQPVAPPITIPAPGNQPQPEPNPTPDPWPWIDPIPPWFPKDDPDCRRDIAQVKAVFPGVLAGVIAYLTCLQPKMSPNEVIALFTLWTSMGMTQQDINNLINRLMDLQLYPGHNQPTRDQIIAFLRNHQQDIPDIWAKYQRIQTIPGADEILKDMITAPLTQAGGSNPTYRGSYFELNWVANRQATLGDVVQIEQYVGGQKGPDVVLGNGTLIDTKSYIWSAQKPFFRNIAISDLTQQLDRYRIDPALAGHPIVYVFDSAGGKLPADIQKVFDDERKLGLNVTVQYWPDPNPPQLVP